MMDVVKVRNILVKILLATLMAAAAVAVGVILLGTTNDIMGRVIWTIVSALFYIGILLAVLSAIPHIGQGPRSRSDLFAINSVLALTCASYLTSILSIWMVIDGDMPWRLHQAYFVFLCGVAYAKPLMNLENTHKGLRRYIYANYVFIALACVLLAIAICAPDDWGLWDNIFGRIIAASAVINVSLSMVITVLYHLETQQNPRPHVTSQQMPAVPLSIPEAQGSTRQEAASSSTVTAPAAPVAVPQPPHQRMSTPMIVLLTILGIFVGLPIAVAILGAILGLATSTL